MFDLSEELNEPEDQENFPAIPMETIPEGTPAVFDEESSSGSSLKLGTSMVKHGVGTSLNWKEDLTRSEPD